MRIMKKTFRLIVSFLIPVILTNASFAVYTDGPSNANYNRTSASQYIYKYSETPNQAYFDYTNVGGDCTNFVSQVLVAGGMQMTYPVSNPSTLDWYYYGHRWGAERSATWTNAHCFSYYWIDINNVGARKAFAYMKCSACDLNINNIWYTIYSYLEPGDIIQYISVDDYITYHSQAVHRTSYENGEFKVSVGQHTNNGWKNLRTYISALPEDTVICFIKIKQPASTSVAYLGTYSGKTVSELEAAQEYLFNLIPLDEIQENEKWSRLRAIKEELIRRAKDGKEINEHVVPISKNALINIIETRMENNVNIKNSIKLNDTICKPNNRAVKDCIKENNELRAFLIKVTDAEERNSKSIKILWNEYWKDIVEQTPPLYYK